MLADRSHASSINSDPAQFVDGTDASASAAGSGRNSDSGATRASLISRARSKNSEAWSQLVELYGPLVAHWCGRCGLSPHATADCVQEVFIAVSRSLERYHPEKATGAFRSWMWTITQNKIRDNQRRENRHTQARGGSTGLANLNTLADELSIPSEEPTSELEMQHLISRGLQQVRAEFEPRSWALFERAVIDHIPTAVVAKEFEVSSAAVRQVRSRILRRLRQQLGDLDA